MWWESRLVNTSSHVPLPAVAFSGRAIVFVHRETMVPSSRRPSVFMVRVPKKRDGSGLLHVSPKSLEKACHAWSWEVRASAQRVPSFISSTVASTALLNHLTPWWGGLASCLGEVTPFLDTRQVRPPSSEIWNLVPPPMLWNGTITLLPLLTKVGVRMMPPSFFRFFCFSGFFQSSSSLPSFVTANHLPSRPPLERKMNPPMGCTRMNSLVTGLRAIAGDSLGMPP